MVANTADDLWVHGLKVCPDLDTVMYTLGDGIDPGRGWGRRDETWSTKEELAAYGVEPTWFGLGDRDIATHLVRTQMLDAGYPLSEVTTALCRRWQPGASDCCPMTDDRVETHIAIADPDEPSGRRVVHFQEYWVRLRAQVPAEAVVVVGLDALQPRRPACSRPSRTPTSSCCPRPTRSSASARSSACPASARRVAATAAPVVGLSPIVGDTHVRGMAHQVLTAIGVEVTAGAVARHYGSRRDGGVLDGWLVDTRDAHHVAAVREAGIACEAVPLMMTDDDATAAMARRRRRARPVSRLEVTAPDGLPEITVDSDLARIITAVTELADGDVVVVTSKVVSKAEGRVRPGDRGEALAEETVRVVASRGPTLIVRNRLGLTMAAAGIDASNVGLGPGRAAAARPGRERARPARRAARAHRRQRGRRHHRHRRAGVARGPDRHRDRRRRAGGRRGLRRPRGPLRQPARRDAARRRRRDRRSRRAGPGQARAADPSPWSAVGPTWCSTPATTAPAPPGWSGPRAATCSGTAPARPSSGRWPGAEEDRPPVRRPRRA